MAATSLLRDRAACGEVAFNTHISLKTLHEFPGRGCDSVVAHGVH
jgi:hypothetical protein